MAELAVVKPVGDDLFTVTWAGAAIPRMMPGRVMLFAPREAADAYAMAFDADDLPECHRIIAEHGQPYRVAEGTLEDLPPPEAPKP